MSESKKALLFAVAVVIVATGGVVALPLIGKHFGFNEICALLFLGGAMAGGFLWLLYMVFFRLDVVVAYVKGHTRSKLAKIA